MRCRLASGCFMERVFSDLCTKLAQLRESFRAAQIAAAHDEGLTAELRELFTALDAIAFSAEGARNASRQSIDVDAIRRALPPCQRQFNLLKQRFASGAGAQDALEMHRAGGRD